jgi:hypothetical protein
VTGAIIGTRVSPGLFDLLGVRPCSGAPSPQKTTLAGARVVANYAF